MNETELRQFSWLHPPTIQLPRKQEIQDDYERYIKTPGYHEFVSKVKDIKNGEKRLLKNNFPYNVKEPIKHSCLWYRGICSPQDVIEYLDKNNISYITFFENPTHLKSIKDVSHYHIFHY